MLVTRGRFTWAGVGAVGSSIPLVWAGIASLPWLLPTHAVPWSTFQAEWAMAVSILGLVFVGTVRSREHVTVDSLTLGLIAAAAIPVIQAAAGMFQVPTEAPLISMYLVGAAITTWGARRIEEHSPGTVVRWLLTSFAIAATISAAIALLQWLSIDLGTNLVAPSVVGQRAVANVGQPNNLATLLVWGLIGMWSLWASGRLNALIVVPTITLVLLGVALTMSRAGLLQVVLLGCAAFVLRKRVRIGSPWVWAGLGAFFVAATLVLPVATQRAFGGGAVRTIVDMESSRERLTVLKLDFAEIITRPWFGWGWNQNIVGHVELHQRFPMHGQVGNAHNLALDLLIWNGLPIGITLIAGVGVWAWYSFKRPGTYEQTFAKIALATCGVHTMLELPHVLAYFLLPAAALAGSLNAHRLAIVRVPCAVPKVIASVCAVYLAALAVDYVTIEENLTSARMRTAGIMGTAPESDPSMWVLSSLQDTLYLLRSDAVRSMPPETLDRMRRAATRFPAAPGLLRYAYAAALNRQPEQSAWTLDVLCALHPESECVRARTSWSALQSGGVNPELRSVRTPWKPETVPSR